MKLFNSTRKLQPMCTRFLEIVSSANVGVCACVSALRTLITNHVKHMRNNWIKQFYTFLYFNMTLAINKLNGCDLIYNAHREHLPKKTKIMQY